MEEDPYDPFVPNDLLEYWERQAVQRALEEQQQVRRELEEKRRQLGAQTTNPVNRMMARGRGRGVSNMPAWLVEKQRKEAELGVVPGSTEDDAA